MTVILSRGHGIHALPIKETSNVEVFPLESANAVYNQHDERQGTVQSGPHDGELEMAKTRKRAIVTGASQGSGAGIVKGVVERG